LIADPTTLTAQVEGGDGWSRTDHLLALIIDELRLANWQRTGKKANRPEPFSPLRQPKRIGHTDRSNEEVIELLDRFGPAEEV
jgi:hypothetical protein